MRFFAGGRREDTAATSDARFRAVFGVSIDDADRSWRTFLAQ